MVKYTAGYRSIPQRRGAAISTKHWQTVHTISTACCIFSSWWGLDACAVPWAMQYLVSMKKFLSLLQ